MRLFSPLHQAMRACPVTAKMMKEIFFWQLSPGSPMSALAAFAWMVWLDATLSLAHQYPVRDLFWERDSVVLTVLVSEWKELWTCCLLGNKTEVFFANWNALPEMQSMPPVELQSEVCIGSFEDHDLWFLGRTA